MDLIFKARCRAESTAVTITQANGGEKYSKVQLWVILALMLESLKNVNVHHAL